jgi:hypothetical protein
VGGSVIGALLLCGIMAAGVWDLVRPMKVQSENVDDKAYIPQMQGGIRWLIGLWAVVTAATMLLLTPLEWQRYYLPMYPVIGLVTGLGVNRLVQRGSQWFHQRAHEKPEAPLSGDDSRPDTLPELT